MEKHTHRQNSMACQHNARPSLTRMPHPSKPRTNIYRTRNESRTEHTIEEAKVTVAMLVLKTSILSIRYEIQNIISNASRQSGSKHRTKPEVTAARRTRKKKTKKDLQSFPQQQASNRSRDRKIYRILTQSDPSQSRTNKFKDSCSTDVTTHSKLR